MKEFSNIIYSLIFRNKARLFLISGLIAITLAVLSSSLSTIFHYKRVINDDEVQHAGKIVAIDIEYLNEVNQLDYLVNYYQNFGEEMVRLVKDKVDGIESITFINGYPYSDSVIDKKVRASLNDNFSQRATIYNGDQNFVNTLGLNLVAGRNFYDSEVQWAEVFGVNKKYPLIYSGDSAIISKALAEKLFGETPAISQKIYLMDDRVYTVVGIVEKMPGANPRRLIDYYYSVILPGINALPHQRMLVKVNDSVPVEMVAANVEQVLSESYTGSVIVAALPLLDIKRNTLKMIVGMLYILLTMSIFLVLVTVIGCYGQVEFSINQRTKQIGIKRAIGATKGDIISYFLIEVAIIFVVGTVLGCILGYLLNSLFVSALGASALGLNVLVPSILFIWLLGFLATIKPAYTAANISPAIATRGV